MKDKETFDDEDARSVQSTGEMSYVSGQSGSNSDEQSGDKEIKNYARKFSRNVDTWRELSAGVLVVVSCFVTAATYIYFSRQETDNFRGRFRTLLDTVHDAASIHDENVKESFAGRSESVTLHAIQSNSKWPFVTEPYFEVYGARAASQSAVEFMAWCPIVEKDNVDEWETYAWDNKWWVDQEKDKLKGLMTKQDTDVGWTDVGRNDVSRDVYRVQNDGTITADLGPGPYAPVWNTAPPPARPDLINYDIISNPELKRLYESMIQKKRTVISTLIDPQAENYVEEESSDDDDKWSFDGVMSRRDLLEDHEHNRIEDDFKALDLDLTVNPKFQPYSMIFEPVFDELQEELSNTSKITGFLAVALPWYDYLAQCLPNNADHLIVVLENDCGQTFTYYYANKKLELMGPEDLHSPHFEYFTKEFNEYKIFDIFKNTTIATEQNATTAPKSDSNFTAEHHIQTHEHDGVFHSHISLVNEPGSCTYRFRIYPTFKYRNSYRNWHAIIFTSIIGASFFSMAVVFVAYDAGVKYRNKKMVNAAAKTNQIVSSLFPSTVRDRLFDLEQTANGGQGNSNASKKSRGNRRNRGRRRRPSTMHASGNLLRNYLDDGDDHETEPFSSEYGAYATKPIADLFPHTTVLFADIVGFTAWSSVREPTQVFTLLETLYHSFDAIAKRRRVFKVETIGDCYVAVTGLPEPRKDHAVVMARFARDCLHQVVSLTKRLEVTLGPDTGDLSMRFGLHSGPTTAGVLRGERSRFQLFGDTVNTAARIESTGRRGRIHLSQETADLLSSAGKSHWITLREDKVTAKGKGELTTYWLTVGETQETESSSGRESIRDVGSYDEGIKMNGSAKKMNPAIEQAVPAGVNMEDLGYGDPEEAPKPLREISQKERRLIDWNVQILQRLLKHIVARRQATGKAHQDNFIRDSSWHSNHDPDKTVLDEVREIITLPKFDSKAAKNQEDPDSVELEPYVIEQLEHFVTTIASMYRENPFHNFEHASHVTMSVVKLLSRIVAPTVDMDHDETLTEKKLKKRIASKMHDHTYGITSDPLTQFAVVLSALIHDVDHVGVPNTQLVKEGIDIAAKYKNRSVAEQNSVDLSWELLMSTQYSELVEVICGTEAEFERFRQLVVNSVMATDIMDKDLKALRNARWDKVFKPKSEDGHSGEEEKEDADADINRKATIVIEHLLQASDVSHTMQHWHIFRKWNERLFNEMLKAFKEGRAEKDPSEFWYRGEIGFFDFYIIPLAKKLKDCGVFGVSSDEYLNYAIHNRDEWVLKGEEIVKTMIENAQKLYEKSPGKQPQQAEPNRKRGAQRRLSLTSTS